MKVSECGSYEKKYDQPSKVGFAEQKLSLLGLGSGGKGGEGEGSILLGSNVLV